MKTFQFAIASIVDTNTGQGLPKNTLDTDRVAANSRPRRSAFKTLVDYLVRIRSGITVARIVLQKRRKLKQGLRQLGELNDRMLEDIGLTRADIIAAAHGDIDRVQRQAQRVRNQDIKRIPTLNPSVIAGKPVQREALNDAVFAKTRCA